MSQLSLGKKFYKWYADYQKATRLMSNSNEQEVYDAFYGGYTAAQQEPANTVEVKAGQVLSRDQRDALCAANAFLTVLQSSYGDGTMPTNRIQKTIDAISDLLYE